MDEHRHRRRRERSQRPALNTLQDNIEQGLVGAGMNPSLAHGVAQGVTTVAAVGAGAAFGGAQGGAAAGMVDANNRALHPSESQKLESLKRGKTPEEQRRFLAALASSPHDNQSTLTVNAGADFFSSLLRRGIFVFG